MAAKVNSALMALAMTRIRTMTTTITIRMTKAATGAAGITRINGSMKIRYGGPKRRSPLERKAIAKPELEILSMSGGGRCGQWRTDGTGDDKDQDHDDENNNKNDNDNSSNNDKQSY